jgi:ABC-type sugar transport system ATPase subunit
MRNGELVLDRRRDEVSMGEVVEGMVGSAQEKLFPPRRPMLARVDPSAGLRVERLSAGDELQNVSFEARPGEVVGLAGLDGSGVATLLGLLFGTRRATSGEVRYPDGGGLPRSPTQAATRGISLVPADRRNQGLMLERSVMRNMTLVSVGAMAARSPWVSLRSMLEATQRQVDRLRIKVSDPRAEVGSLSGGNQQKVVLGRWLEAEPRLLLLDDPTRGVDVGAKHEIYLLIRQLAEEGRVVLFRSTELPELVGLADRILVFHRGSLVLELDDSSVTDREVLHAINTGSLAHPGQGSPGPTQQDREEIR